MHEHPTEGSSFALIQIGHEDAIRAIRSHPAETVALFASGCDAFWRSAGDRDTPLPTNFTPQQKKLVLDYLLAMSFISAWFHLYGDRQRRDKAVHAAVTLVANRGWDTDATFDLHFRFEMRWRRLLRQERIGPGRTGCATGLVILALTLYATQRLLNP